MKPFRLLLDADCEDPVASLCSALGGGSSIVDAAPVRRSANLRLFQVDVPDIPARVLSETARQAGVSVETLLMDWISLRGAEMSHGTAGGPQPILAKCRRIADWCLLGYTDQADRIAALAEKLLGD